MNTSWTPTAAPVDKIDYNEDGATNLLDIYIDQNGDGAHQRK